MTTNAQVVQLFTDVLTRWNEREAEFRDWQAGTAEGGPNADGRYPLTNGSNETYLVASPAKLASTVSGPAVLSQAAQVAAEAAQSASETASTQANSSRIQAENFRNATLAARDLALLYRDQCAAAQATVLSAKTVVEAALVTIEDNLEIAEGLTNETLDARDDTLVARSEAMIARDQAEDFAASINPALLATKAELQSELDALIDAAPGTLNTLNEIAAALGDDPNFATTITNSVAGKAPLVHTHVISDVTGLDTALAGKQPVGNYVTTVSFTWDNISGKPTTFTPSAHTHVISEVSGLQAALDGKQASLGFTPYNASNPAGYITSSALSSYMPLSGGTLTGGLNVTNGNLLVGVTSPVFPTANRGIIEVNGASQALYGMGVGGTAAAYILHDGTDMEIVQSRNGYMRFATNGGERMRLTSVGELLVGRSVASGLGKLNVEGGADFTGGNVYLARDTGSVGVGTSSPSGKVQINSSASGTATRVLALANPNDVTGTAADLDFICHSSGTLATGRIRGLVGGPDNYPLAFYTYGGGLAERMRIDASGNVGIGMSSPAYKLDVSGQSRSFGTPASFAQLQSLTQYTGSSAPLALGQGSDATGFLVNVANASLAFGTNNTERMRIDASGSVGIGTSSPSAKLHVSGGPSTLRLQNTDNASFSGVEFFDSAAARGQIFVGGSSYGSFGGAGSINYSANSGPHVWYTNYAERMRIDASGNVGIGTTTPTNALDVRGAINSTQSADTVALFSTGSGLSYFGTTTASNLALITNGAERLRITVAGDVGIGTSSPNEKLSVAGNIAVGFDTASSNTVVKSFTTGHAVANRGATITFGMTDSALVGMKVWNEAAANASFNRQYITFNTHEGGFSAGERMRIDSYGNVGIGNTTPRGLMHIGTSAAAADIPVPSGNFIIARGGSYGSASVGGIQLSGGYGDAGSVAAWQIKSVGSGGAGAFANNLLFTTQDSFSGSETERMRISATGAITAGGLGMARWTTSGQTSGLMTVSTAAPSGGSDGDIWYKVAS